jgi:hypothetical protein
VFCGGRLVGRSDCCRLAFTLDLTLAVRPTYLHTRSRMISWSSCDIWGLFQTVSVGEKSVLYRRTCHVVSVKGDDVLKIALAFFPAGAMFDEAHTYRTMHKCELFGMHKGHARKCAWGQGEMFERDNRCKRRDNDGAYASVKQRFVLALVVLSSADPYLALVPASARKRSGAPGANEQ